MYIPGEDGGNLRRSPIYLEFTALKSHNRVMARVIMEADAAQQYVALPPRIKPRVERLLERLKKWPEVSGAKPLRGKLAGRFRLRTGDYRLQFHLEGSNVIVEKIGHRDRFYGD